MHRNLPTALCLCVLMVLSTTLSMLAVPFQETLLPNEAEQPSQVGSSNIDAFTGALTSMTAPSGSILQHSIPLEEGYRMTNGSFVSTFEGESVNSTTAYNVAAGSLTGTGTGTLIDGSSIVLETALAGPPQAGTNTTVISNQVSWSGTHAYDTLELTCVSSTCGHITASGALTIYANTVRINTGASITADDITTGGTGQGGATTTSSAGRNDGGGGGGYGGSGATGGGASGGSGGQSYGNGSQAGSQGGAVSSSVHPAVSGGLGGGYLRIVASSVIVNGTVQASGGDGDHGGQMSSGTGTGGSGGGGGSGGAISIQTNSLTVGSTGSVRANGGDGGDGANGVQNGIGFGMYDGGDGGGGGGGGRILIATQSGQYTNAGTVQAAGGGGGTKGLRYGTGVDGVDGSSGSTGVVTASTWNGYVSTSNATVNDGAFITDPITTQSGSASQAYVNHQFVQPGNTNLSVFQRYTLAGNTTTFDHWTAWMEGNINGESLPRHRHVQFMYVLNRTGSLSPEVSGFTMETTAHSVLSNYVLDYNENQDLLTSCTTIDCGDELGATSNFTQNGSGSTHTVRVELPLNATFTGDMHLLVQWEHPNATGEAAANLTSVSLGTSTVSNGSVERTAFGHDLLVPMTALNQAPRMFNGRLPTTSGMEWSVIDVTVGFDGPVTAIASNLIVPWNYTALVNVTSAVNSLILQECGSFYASTAGQCLGTGTDYRIGFAGSTTPLHAPLFEMTLSQPSFVWMDDIAPQITTLEHRQGTAIQPSVRVGESYSMIVLDGANEQDLNVEFLGYDWTAGDGDDEAVSMTYSPPLGGYYLTVPNTGLNPTQTHQTNLVFRATDANMNELTPYPVYPMTVYPAAPSVESLTVEGSTLESGNTSTGTWGISNASFDFHVTEAHHRPDLEVGVDLHHALLGTTTVPLTWNASNMRYTGSWLPLRGDIGQWSLETTMVEPSGLGATVEDGYQMGSDAVITLTDSNGPTITEVLHDDSLEAGELLSVNVSWSGERDETYSGAINLMNGDDLVMRKLILTTPHITASAVFNLTGVEPGNYTVEVQLIDDQGNPASPFSPSGLTVLEPWVTGTVLTGQHNDVEFRAYGETSFRTGEGTVTVTMEGNNWTDQRNISSGTFDLMFAFGGPTAVAHRFTVTMCDADNRQECLTQTVEVDYTASLNLAVTSSCQMYNGTTDSSDEHLLVSCLVTNSGPVAAQVTLESNESQRLTGGQHLVEPMQSIEVNLAMPNGSTSVAFPFQWNLTVSNPVNENTLDQGNHEATRTLPEAPSTNLDTQDGASSETEGGWLVPIFGVLLLAGAMAGATVLMRRRPESEKDLEPVALTGHVELDESQGMDAGHVVASEPTLEDSTAFQPAPETVATSVDDQGYEWYTFGEQHWYRTAGSEGTWFPYEG